MSNSRDALDALEPRGRGKAPFGVVMCLLAAPSSRLCVVAFDASGRTTDLVSVVVVVSTGTDTTSSYCVSTSLA